MHIVMLIIFLLCQRIKEFPKNLHIVLIYGINKMIRVTLTALVYWKYSTWNQVENNMYIGTRFKIIQPPVPAIAFHYGYGHWLIKPNQMTGDTNVVIFLTENI